MSIIDSIVIDDYVFKKVVWQLVNFQFINVSIIDSISIDDFCLKMVVF